MDGLNDVQQVKLAADQLTLACAHLVGAIPMAIGLANLRQMADPLPDDLEQLCEMVSKIERKDQ